MSRVFFYGLFMDERLLREKGLNPVVVGPARLPDFQIHIGERATLVPKSGAESFGVLMELTDRETQVLYSDPGVSDYQPVDVQTVLLEDSSVMHAQCYNLPADAEGNKANPVYARRLAALLCELGFPDGYASQVLDATPQ